jgi:hypothetical protein
MVQILLRLVGRDAGDILADVLGYATKMAAIVFKRDVTIAPQVNLAL